MKLQPIYYLSLIATVASLYFLDLRHVSSKIPGLRRLTGDAVISKFGDITTPKAFYIKLKDYVHVFYEVNEETQEIILAMRIDIPDQYFSIGFSADGAVKMAKSDIWVFEIDNSNAVTAGDYWSRGSGGRPKKDTAGGGTEDVTLLGYELTDTYTLVKVKRLLKTADTKNDVEIDIKSTRIIWGTAGKSKTMSFHKADEERGAGSFKDSIVPDPNVEPPPVTPPTIPEAPFNVMKLHAIMLLVVWGLVVDLGLVVIRLLRGKNINFGLFKISAQAVHIILMDIISISTFVGVGVAIYKMEFSLENEFKVNFHFFNGLVLTFLLILSGATGALSYVGIIKKTSNLKSSFMTTKTFHKVVGILLYVLTRANLITGAIIYEDELLEKITYGYVISSFVIQIMIQGYLTTAYKRTNRKGLVTGTPSTDDQNRLLIQAINDGTPREKIIAYFPDIIWVMLGNKVYDVTSFNHPGGNFILRACTGREIGRYFFGNYALEGTGMKPHTHSSLTISQIEQFYIGEVTNYESVLVYASDKTIFSGTDTGKDSVVIANKDEVWRIAQINRITKSAAEVQFKPQNSELKFRPLSSNVNSLGRHFKISFNNNVSQSRLYTTALSLNEANTKFRQGLYQYFDEIMAHSDPANSNIEFNYDNNYARNQGVLSFFIKNYTGAQGLSNAIKNIDLEGSKNSFRIEGPIGRGLELASSSTGKHVIFAAGTGILPFADFLNMFLLKNMYELIKRKAGIRYAEKMNPLNLQLDNIMNGMEITLVASFSNKEEAFGMDIIKKLVEINAKYNTQNFTAIVRGFAGEGIQTVKNKFDKEFIRNKIGAGQEKYYICGPPQMNGEVQAGLIELGVNEHKIMLV